MSDLILNRLRRQIVNASYNAGEGHIPSSLSILDILWVLYDRIIMSHTSNNRDPKASRFVLSKGHASLALYVILAEKHFFYHDTIQNFCKYDGLLGGHPDCNKVPGVEASPGALGHGLPIAVGMALGFKIQESNNKVYCLIGDGECNEGTIWESALLASHHKLSNICCIVDYNRSTDRALMIDNLVNKFFAFGWEVSEIDGHNHEQLYAALSQTHIDKPIAIVAKTIKGHGIRRMENEPAWHHRVPNEQEYEDIMNELA